MTNAQLRARELVMEQTLGWYAGVADEFFDNDALYRACLVRQAEAAIEAALDERLYEIEREGDNFHSHVYEDGSITIVPGHRDDCQSRWCERAKVAERARGQGPSQ